MANTYFDPAALSEFYTKNRSLVDSELARLFDREPVPQAPKPLPPFLSAASLLRWYAANRSLVDSERARLTVGFDRSPLRA
jgi:hypothetical protein